MQSAQRWGRRGRARESWGFREWGVVDDEDLVGGTEWRAWPGAAGGGRCGAQLGRGGRGGRGALLTHRL